MKISFTFFILSLCACTHTSKIKSFQEKEIGFTNRVQSSDSFNIIQYLYFYNGAGVAASDFNHDNLTDLFFVSNTGQHHFYLNKGNMEFEDISVQTNIRRKGSWATGVSVADVNADGYDDIYICYLGDYKGQIGQNELYINQGQDGLSFEEQAHEYGLDFRGFSSHAVFFDYDQDGDLDMYLLNHSIHANNTYQNVSIREDKHPTSGDRLYQQRQEEDSIYFVDVSEQAGIYQSGLGYGLAVSAGDINQDGYPDLYVSNDFHEDDYLYINQKDGTFKHELKKYIGHTSRFSMGNDIADINNDGRLDILSLDMLSIDERVIKESVGEDNYNVYAIKLKYGYQHQYMRNTLQLNRGNHFSEIALAANIAATDWSWSALFYDFDNDSYKDLFISTGIERRPNNLDYIRFISNQNIQRFASDSVLISKMPSGKVPNKIFKNIDGVSFEDKTEVWTNFGPSLSNGAIATDLDNDGDIDLVTNNLNEPSRIFENLLAQASKNHFVKFKLKQIGAKVYVYTSNYTLLQEVYPNRGFLSSNHSDVHFGLGEMDKIDSVLVVWNINEMSMYYSLNTDTTYVLSKTKTGKPVLGTMERNYQVDTLAFKHQEDYFIDLTREVFLPRSLSLDGPAVAIADVNGDGLEDIFLGKATSYASELLIQKSSGKFVKKDNADFVSDRMHEDVSALFVDVDNDEDQDLIVGSAGNRYEQSNVLQGDRLYFNDGRGNFTKAISYLPLILEETSVIRDIDLDQDGDRDLCVGIKNVVDHYGDGGGLYFLKNNGKGYFSIVQDTFKLKDIGMVRDIAITDINADGKEDVIVVGAWMPITVLTAQEKGFAVQKIKNTKGWWNKIAVDDLDGDGDMDVVLGNTGVNMRFKPSTKNKLRMWVKDIDKNGSIEQFICYPIGDKYYPIAQKDEIVARIPQLKKYFLAYKDFAGKSIDEIFPNEDWSLTQSKEVDNFKSILLEYDSGNFKPYDLPEEIQWAWVNAIHIIDINQDNKKDILIGGNTDSFSPYFGKSDALPISLLIQSSNKWEFKVIPTVYAQSNYLHMIKNKVFSFGNKQNIIAIDMMHHKIK